MEGVREYLLSVTAGAMLCGILMGLAGEKGSLSGLLRLICGLFLSFTVIAPLARIQIRDAEDFLQNIRQVGEDAVDQGETVYEETLRQIITDETRAYIMDKARSYGAEVQVEIHLSDTNPPVPEFCTILGAVSPYVKQQLKKMLIADLGIPEENQTWIQSGK